MKPIQHVGASVAGTVVTCDLLAYHSVRATCETIAQLRRRPGPGAGESLPPNLLKHADEQTVLSVAAVLEAIHHSELAGTDFNEWGVVAAPSFLGRATLANAVKRLEVEGAWGISPHFIPHRSLHAVSGTISQVLRIHGPNLGAGGAPGGGIDALLAGAVLLVGNRLPGVWIVLSDWEPEAIPDEAGAYAPAHAVCRATALALAPARPIWEGPRLHIAPYGYGERPVAGTGNAMKSLSGLHALLGILAGANSRAVTAVWQLEDGGWIELKSGPVSAPKPKHELLDRFLARSLVEVERGGAATENQR